VILLAAKGWQNKDIATEVKLDRRQVALWRRRFLSGGVKHRHDEWLKFLRLIDRRTPKDQTLDLIADNYATHKHPDVRAWLAKHPRFVMHFTPTSASWLNMVERFFRDISELERAIAPYIEYHNENPKPFVWTATASDILAKVTRAKAALVGDGR
jgi:transposase